MHQIPQTKYPGQTPTFSLFPANKLPPPKPVLDRKQPHLPQTVLTPIARLPIIRQQLIPLRIELFNLDGDRSVKEPFALTSGRCNFTLREAVLAAVSAFRGLRVRRVVGRVLDRRGGEADGGGVLGVGLVYVGDRGGESAESGGARVKRMEDFMLFKLETEM